MKDKMFSDYLSDVKERVNSLSNEEKNGLINILNHSAAPVLKKVFGSEMGMLSNAPTKKKRGLAARK